MAEPYTPTTESIRRDYAEHRKDCMHSPSYEQSRRFREDGSGEGEFDRWFASEIEKAEQRGREQVRDED
jgi:hypothetical protein